MLVLTRMNQILEVSAEELLARVESGVTHHRRWPTPPLPRACCTRRTRAAAPSPPIGGNVATCAGGLRGLKYGVTRNYVLGVEAVLPTGEVIQTGGRLWKDVAGYDLTRLLTGSEGTLAVITEITVALLPMPAADATPGSPTSRPSPTPAAPSPRSSADGIVPATLEFLDAKCIGAVEEYAHLGLRLRRRALLLFGDDGARPTSVDRNLERIGRAVHGDRGASRLTLAESICAGRRRCSPRAGATLPALSRLGTLTILEDATVPRPRLAEMVDRIDEIAARARRADRHVRARRRRQPAPDAA